MLPYGVMSKGFASPQLRRDHPEPSYLPSVREAMETLTVQPADAPSAELLTPLVSPATLLPARYRSRNNTFEFKSVHPADIDSSENNGWEVQRRGKRSVRVRRPKEHSRLLEDRVWCLLYRMGYKTLNDDRFNIRFTRSNGSAGRKQIDVFACDAEVAFVVECKSREARGRRSLQKDIHETKALQDYIRKSIFSLFKGPLKPKIVWMYATTNIIWSENDVARAVDAGVQIVTENELQYFDSFVKHLGPAARYQILGDMFAGQRISGMGTTKVPAIRSRIGNHKAYYFMTTPRVLLKLAFINHQALNHPDGRPAYQRMISSKRIKDIGEFIIGGGFFPTNLLLNFQSSPRFDLISNKENTHESVKFGWLTLPPLYRSAWIIDGQHRLYGFSKLDDRYLDNAISVIAFDQLNPHKEADLFITINHEQKSVPKSLLVTLLADLRLEDSHPKKRLAALCSAVVRALNSDPSSPLSRRFAVQGLAPEEGQDLTVSEAVNGLVRSGLLGRVTHEALAYGPLAGATDDATIERARVVLNGYFEALRRANEGRWEKGRKAYICVNPGIRAHLTLVGEAVRYLEARKGIYFADLKENEFVALLRDIASPIFEFVRDATDEVVADRFARKFGEGGVREYLYNLCAIVNKAHPNFGSDEFREYLA
jgi:DNA sulfur modification protein DndB